ncbi:LacI family DNA-binding transcriptional regulator [Paenibacillus arenilitoris]|uniref:LacI family DNA-binding transcriptional regulator n=1 Tax=Paenibacillus arenilitoris TaxID=2772299 RepID=A0A927CFE6_9BACL|nr:LacI family DNA-binding transcriptional regulator [Paenibacillus arenilitoris]MBD2867073.1 LacI family DNA-binding transcriptional regulator [Paenibacillus arenilitoris]
MSTIREVARLANVSIATVSRVLNNDSTYKITEETRAKVWQAVTQLNYKISSNAKRQTVVNEAPASKPAMKIGCVLSVTKDKYNDPYFMSILSGAEERLIGEGCDIAFVRTGYELEDKKILFNTFNEPITGLILMESLNGESYDYIRKQVPYIVGIDTAHRDIDNVGYDHHHVASAAVRHLIDNGHKEIGFIGGSGAGNIKDSQRYRGYYATMHAAGLPVRPEWVIDCMWDEAVCMERINRLCVSGSYPKAFFAASDLMAMAALSAFYNNGISVPDRVAVIGMSNIEMSKYTSPPLSTVHVPTKEIGMVAVDLLFDRINGNDMLPRKVLLPTELIVRSST